MTKIRVLSRDNVAESLIMGDVIETVESVYCAKSEGLTEVWPTVFNIFEPGKADLDIKSGYLKDRDLYGHKTVSWFADNEKKNLPSLFGLIAVYDGKTGMPHGILDGSYITGIRTGAAGALGAKYLAREDSQNLLIVGAGNQAAFQIAAILTLFPSIKNIRIADRLLKKAQVFVSNIAAHLLNEFHLKSDKVNFEAATNLGEAVRSSDIIITVTPSHEPIIKNEWVVPGTHFSCIGADMEGKQELESSIVARALTFVDDKAHCMKVGEIELPLKQALIREEHIVGELGDLATGKVSGRASKDQITLFDATGMALLDIATADMALRVAEENGLGTEVEL